MRTGIAIIVVGAGVGFAFDYHFSALFSHWLSVAAGVGAAGGVAQFHQQRNDHREIVDAIKTGAPRR